jgi:hypothetical protein
VATWGQLTNYIRDTYQSATEDPNHLVLHFATGEDRSQLVHLFHQQLMDGQEHWVQIESIVCEATTEQIERSARVAGDAVCGAVAVVQNSVIFRHSVPLENLDVNEFERPLELVTTTADYIESLVTGADEY